MNKPKLIVMVGLSASGKSTIAKMIAEEENYVIISSDNIREEICEGGVADQSKNDEVFRIFHKRIKDCLMVGYNVIADATNITIKSRRVLLENVKNINCEKIAYIVPKSTKQCMEDNICRMHPVPTEVIKRQESKFQIPFYEEGWDEIKIHGFEDLMRKFNPTFFNDCLDRMKGFGQKNPYHTMSLYEHCEYTTDLFEENKMYLPYLYGSKLHDIGKLFTQSIDENGIAHYYGHAEVGAYYLLCNVNEINKECGFSILVTLNMLFLVNYHMLPMNWNNDKTKDKWKKIFGEEKFQMLMDFNECDKARD